MTMQCCPGEEWALKALAAYDGLIENRTRENNRCCWH